MAVPTRTPTGEGAAVSVDRVCKLFPSKSKPGVLEALRNVSVDIAPGEFISIVGPSGCGKSTLLMTVAGLQQATSGRVTINGSLIDGPTDIMGVAFQRDCLMDWRTVLGNVLAQTDLRGWKRSEWTRRALDLLDMVGLSGFDRSYPQQLSGGMRQRVALCRALLHEPRILLLDEPFGAVDAMTREQLNDDVGRLCAESGVTTLLVTHDINEAVFMGDRVVVMTARPGRIAGVVRVSMPTPRPPAFRGTQAFLSATVEIRSLLERAEKDGSHLRATGPDAGRTEEAVDQR